MRRLKTKAARDHRDVDGISSSPATSASGTSFENSASLRNSVSGSLLAEELVSQISSSLPDRLLQLLATLKSRGVLDIESAALRACLVERFWHCLQHGFISVGASIIVCSQLWEPPMFVLACVAAADPRSSEKAGIVDTFLSCPNFPEQLVGSVLEKLSPDFAIKLIRKHHFDLCTFPLFKQYAVFKELAWICSQFDFNQVFGTLLISAIASYPDIPVLAFVKQRLPHFFDSSKQLFLTNPSAHLLPSLPPPLLTPSDSYSLPSHVNMRLVTDRLGLLECIRMVCSNLVIGLDMEWSGCGALSHSTGQVPADVIQIGNSPSALLCSVFLLDARAVRHEVSLIETLFCEMFSPARTVLVCDFSADRLALSAAFPQAKFTSMVAPQLLDLSLTCGKRKKSLSSLAKEFCHVNLSKSWQICGWSFRPWLPSQLEYATIDVLVMHMIYEQQQVSFHMQPAD
jgi:hypothetical protein